jgi:hypothetical protein
MLNLCGGGGAARWRQKSYDYAEPQNRQYWYILWPFGKFYNHLVFFMVIWYILWPFGKFSPFCTLYQEKSGNPVVKSRLI